MTYIAKANPLQLTGLALSVTSGIKKVTSGIVKVLALKSKIEEAGSVCVVCRSTTFSSLK